jgi:hypothetical protein
MGVCICAIYEGKYRVLRKAYMAGVARHSFAIGIINKWECVYGQFNK